MAKVRETGTTEERLRDVMKRLRVLERVVPKGTAVGTVEVSAHDDTDHTDAPNAKLPFTDDQHGSLGAGLHADDIYLPTPDQKDALVGTNGTPSATDPYVTNSDPRLSGGGGGGGGSKAFALFIG